MPGAGTDPELFTEYDRLGADGVLVSYSTAGVTHHEHIAVQARGTAVTNTCWISLAVPANPDGGLQSGVIDPPIGATYPPDQFGQALQDMEDRKTLGKSVVTLR